MKNKTSELTGAALDWAVAKCEGEEVRIDPRHLDLWIAGGPMDDRDTFYSPSTVWSQGGPIIECERIIIECERITVSAMTTASFWKASKEGAFIRSGASPLIAAMRCYVASKLGDEVEVPKDIT